MANGRIRGPVNNPSASSANGVWEMMDVYRAMINSSWPLVDNHVLLGTQTVGVGGAASVTFSSIPSTYRALQLRGIGQAVATSRLGMSLNGDTTLTNYNSHFVYGDGASAASGYSANAWSIAAAAQNGSMFGGFVLDLLDYASASKYKTWRSLGGYDNNGSGLAIMYSGLWRSTAAVTSLTFYGAENSTSGTLTQYSQFDLYGIL